MLWEYWIYGETNIHWSNKEYIYSKIKGVFFIRFYVFDILDNIFAFHLVLNLEFKLLLHMKEPWATHHQQRTG